MSTFTKIKMIIPSTLTLLNLCCGFIAIALNDAKLSVILLLIALVLDVLDGVAARLLNAQSEMGRELDSLADLTSFGVAPAYLYYALYQQSTELYTIIPPLFIVIGSALRLAKFNLLPSSKYFSGLPTPASALFIIGLVLGYHMESKSVMFVFEHFWLYALLPIFLCFLMVSRLPMFSLKSMEKDMAKNTFQILLLVVFIAMLLINNKIATPLAVLVYILLSAIQTVTRRDKDKDWE